MDKKRIVIFAVAALLVLGGAAALLTPKGGTLPASGDVTNAQLRDAVAKGARLIDVRTVAEYTGGHIDGAENVPIDTLPSVAGSWAKTSPVALYCQTGARSANGFAYLKGQGFTNVYNLTNGVSAWDGDLVKGSSAGTGGPGKAPATGRPTMYDFTTNS